MYRIIWLSRHEPLPAQVAELKSAFGEVDIVQESRTWTDVEDIVNMLNTIKYDDIVVVLPESIIRKLIDRNIKPLRAVMQQLPPGEPFNKDTDVMVNGRHYRFMEFRRVLRYEFITAPLKPMKNVLPKHQN